jgi:hypothetical protein
VYFIEHSHGERTRVCKHACKSIFGVQDTRLRNLARKIVNKDRNLTTDGRGKHGNQVKIDTAIPEQVKAHIAKFPTEASHYCPNSEKRFLDSELSVQKMYFLYLEDYEPAVHATMFQASESSEEAKEGDEHADCKPACTYQRYLAIFNEHFNLQFGKISVDTCGLCDRLQSPIKSAAPGDERKELEQQHQQHLSQADMSYKMRTRDQEMSIEDETKKSSLPMPLRIVRGTEVISCHYMSNTCLPKLSCGESWYLRKLRV